VFVASRDFFTLAPGQALTDWDAGFLGIPI
jgi:hypothetical protein